MFARSFVAAGAVTSSLASLVFTLGCSSPQAAAKPFAEPGSTATSSASVRAVASAAASIPAAAPSARLKPTAAAGAALKLLACKQQPDHGAALAAWNGAQMTFTRDGTAFAMVVEQDQPAKVTLHSLDRYGISRWSRTLLHGERGNRYQPGGWPIAVDSSGNGPADVVIAASFAGVLSVGKARLASPHSTNPVHLQPFVVRFDDHGQLRWARQLAEGPSAVVSGLVMGQNGGVMVAVTPMFSDAKAAVYRVDRNGQVEMVHSFEGDLLAIAQLPNGSIASVSRPHQPPGQTWLRIHDAAGAVTIERKLARSESAALATTAAGELWAWLEFSPFNNGMASLAALGVDASEKDGSAVLLKMNAALDVQGAVQSRGRANLLVPLQVGGMVVGHTDFITLPGHPSERALNWLTAYVDANGTRALPAAPVMLGMRAGAAEACVNCAALCQKDGRCSLQQSQCVAADAGQCKASSACIEQGRCTLKDGACVAASAADCARSTACKSEGACGLVDGQCLPTEARHCRAATSCRESGRCSYLHAEGSMLGGHRCIAATDADCQRSTGCRTQRLCGHSDSGFCEVKDGKLCALTQGCREAGQCHLYQRAKPFGLDTCEVQNAADCRNSINCRDKGECTNVVYHQQEADDVTACELRSDEDCKRSQLCKRHGKCRYEKRQCVN